MGRYTKMPVTIEAVQFTGIESDQALFEDGQPDCTPPPLWLLEAMEKQRFIEGAITPFPRENTLEIVTLEGIINARPGDWIIRGVKGELYPCKPNIFDEIYTTAADAEYMAAMDKPPEIIEATDMPLPPLPIMPPNIESVAATVSGAALIEMGKGWVKVHGLPDAEPLFQLLQGAKIASERA